MVTALVALLAVSCVLAGSVAWVRHAARGHVYPERTVPPAPVALVFGAQVYADGTPSPFLVGRLRVALRLYRAGTVRVLLVTGDHGRRAYDEPDAMRRWLIRRGVPARKVVADYAGFDTYQSCARAVRIFGVRHAIVVSQDFHVPRAVALCRSVGIRADGVGDRTERRRHPRTYLRGWVRGQLADVKAVYSMVVQPDPRYLGPRETGVRDALTS